MNENRGSTQNDDQWEEYMLLQLLHENNCATLEGADDDEENDEEDESEYCVYKNELDL